MQPFYWRSRAPIFRLFPPGADSFELNYFLEASPYRVGNEFSPRPKTESLPIHDTVYLSYELFRESDIEIVRVDHGPE